MREKFNEILKNHGIYGNDVEDVLDAVHDMLIYVADKTKEEAPHATNSINRMETAAYEVFELRYEL